MAFISFWNLLKLAFVAWITFKLYQLIIRELIYIIYYKRQGLSLDYYYPFHGLFRMLKNDEDKYNDCNGTLKEAIRKDPHKKTFLVNAFGKICIILFDPKLIEEFFRKIGTHYEKEKFVLHNITRLISEDIFSQEGKRWKVHRKILSEAFAFESLHKMLPIINEGIDDHLAVMIKKKHQKQVNILAQFQNMVGNSVLKMFFGRDLSNHVIEGQPITNFFAKLIVDVSEQTLNNPLSFIFGPEVGKYNLTSNDRRISRNIETMKKIATETLEMRLKATTTAYQKGEERQDILGYLLDYNMKNPEDALSEKEMIDSFTFLFVAGMDTTAHLLTFAVYCLIKHSECLNRVRAEAEEKKIKLDDIKIEDLANLKYLDAFLKEVLRFYPPAFLYPREAKSTHQLGDLTILKGTMVTISPGVLGFNELHHDQPYEFKPERFMEENASNTKRSPFSYLPFSAGARNCIGKYLAMIETKIILLRFLDSFNFNLSNPDFKLKMGYRFLYDPVDPVEIDLELRQN